jgi:hypothetical protein
MLALLGTVPETTDDPNGADRPDIEYGLDLSCMLQNQISLRRLLALRVSG